MHSTYQTTPTSLPASEGGETVPLYLDDQEFQIASPFTPTDYKTLAMEMAYLTPRRTAVSSRSSLNTSGSDQDSDRDKQQYFFQGSSSSDASKESHRLISPYRTYRRQESQPPGKVTLALFAASILFLFADQNLLAPNLTAVARDFGFDDAQRDIKLGGQIPFAFFVVGGVVSVVVGPLADVMNRKNLYVWTCLVGTIPCLLTYWVTSFEQFFILRTLTGVAVGGAFPLIYSLASDVTTPDKRALASSIITISMGLGSSLGQMVAGFVGPVYGWRLPFVIIALPSIFIISLVVLTMEEPERSNHVSGIHRGGGKQSVGGRRMMNEEEMMGHSLARNGCTTQLRKFLDVFIIKTNLLAFCQSMPGCLPWGVISAFLTDYLHSNRGMTVEGATGLMFIFGLGCFAGNLAGGIIGQMVYNRSKEAAAFLMAATTALGFLPMAWLINTSQAIATPSGGFTLLAAFVAFCGGIAAFTGPLVRAFVMQVNSSRNRGTVFSVFMVADDLGKGLGPAIVSLLIPSLGRVTAFNLSLGGWGVCALFLFLMVFTIRADEEALIRNMKEGLQSVSRGGSQQSIHV